MYKIIVSSIVAIMLISGVLIPTSTIHAQTQNQVIEVVRKNFLQRDVAVTLARNSFRAEKMAQECVGINGDISDIERITIFPDNYVTSLHAIAWTCHGNELYIVFKERTELVCGRGGEIIGLKNGWLGTAAGWTCSVVGDVIFDD